MCVFAHSCELRTHFYIQGHIKPTLTLVPTNTIAHCHTHTCIQTHLHAHKFI